MSSPSDRRRAARIEVCIHATLEVLAPARSGPLVDPGFDAVGVTSHPGGAPFEGTLQDLSVDGAKIAAASAPPTTSRVSVAFDLPGYGSALAMAIVMWRREGSAPCFGVRFEAVDLGVRKTIAAMVQAGVSSPRVGG